MKDLELVQALVASALKEVPRDSLTIESSQRLAELRAVVGEALTGQSRAIILGVLSGAAGSVLMTIWSLVLLRRKDFGRRRALGATRAFILVLIVSQVGIIATAGSVLGGIVGVAALAIGRQPVPPLSYLLALCVALTVAATAAAAVPAAWASRREPLSELRVP